jgi:hypothetical protein
MDSGIPDKVKEAASIVGDFGRAFVDGAVLNAYDGVAQLANHVTGHDLLPMAALHKQRQVSFTDPHWQAEMLGQAAGTAFQIAAISKVASSFAGAGDDISAQATRLSGKLSPLQAAGTGFLLGSVFQPSDEHNFWQSRLANGAGTAAALTAFSWAGGKMDSLSRARAGIAEVPAFSLPLTTELRNNVLAGTLAGAVGTETTSVVGGQGLKFDKDLLAGAYSFGLTGGMMAGYYRANRAYTSDVNRYVNTSDPEQAPIRSSLLSYLARTDQATPEGWLKAIDALPRTELGLPDKNLDLSVWRRGAERSQLLDLLRGESVGAFSYEHTPQLIRDLSAARVGDLGQALKAARAAGDASAIQQAQLDLQSGLTQSLSNFTERQGLPPVQVEVGNDFPGKINGMWSNDRGVLVLNEKLLYNGLSSEAVEFIQHEGTHFEQYALKQRQAQGETLTPEETARLEALQAAHHEYSQHPGAQQIMQVDQILKQLSERWPTMTDAEKAMAQPQIDDLFAFRVEAANNYIGAQFEREAWVNGVLGHITARSLGLRPPANDPTLFSEPKD